MKKTALFILFVALSGVVSAQWIIDGGSTETQDVDRDERPGDLVIGDQDPNNGLTVLPNVTIVARYGYLGYTPNSFNNTLVLNAQSGAGFEQGLIVGFWGGDNSVFVGQDAALESARISIGAASTANNNNALVNGGELRAFGTLLVGEGSSFNTLTLTNESESSADYLVVGGLDSADGNEVIVDDSTLSVNETLTVGTENNESNRVSVGNGGTIEAGELVILGSNSFDLNDEGFLWVGSDFNAATNGFNWNAGGALRVEGELTGLAGSLESNRVLQVYSDLDLSGQDFALGTNSSGSRIDVAEGGTFLVDNFSVGTGSNVSDNVLQVSGAASHAMISGALDLGSSTSSNNAVLVEASGKLSVGGLVTIEDGNTLTVQSGGWLNVSNAFDAGQSGFVFGNRGILEVGGALTGMTNELDDTQTLLLTGGTWNVGTNELHVGSGSSANQLWVTDGGTLTSTAAVIGSGSGAANNLVVLSDAGSSWNNSGSLTLGGLGGGNLLIVSNEASVSTAELQIGLQSSGNQVWVSDTNSMLSVTSELNVGAGGNDNLLAVENGASLSTVDAFIGTASNQNNEVKVEGAGSSWNNGGNLTVTGANNAIHLLGGAQLSGVQALAVQDGAMLEIEGKSLVSAAAYQQSEGSVLSFNSVTNEAFDPGTALIDVSGTATFESNAVIHFAGEVGDSNIGITNSRKVVSSSSLNVIGGLGALNGGASNSLLTVNFAVQSDDLYMQLYRTSLAESAGFETNSQMYNISTNIDALASDGSQAANNQLAILGQLSGGTSGQQNAQLRQLYERNAPTYMHMEGLFEGMRQVQSRGIMPDTYWAIGPSGPQGPHLYGEQSQLWFKGYGSWGTQDADSAYSGYDQSVYGLVVGWDKAFGDLLFGLAGGYSSSNIKQDDGDKSDSGLGYGILYGSWGTTDWFADGNLAYGFGSVENKTGTAFDTKSDADMSQFGFYLGGGKEMVFRDDKLFLTPTLAILGGNYAQDGYTEKSSNSVTKKVDDYNRWSFKSDIGAEMAFRKELEKSVLMPDVHAKWLHEFNTDADSVGYTLIGGTGNYSYTMMAPVSDLFEVGVGLSLWTENKQGTVYEFALGYDARFGSGYLANVLDARVNIEF